MRLTHIPTGIVVTCQNERSQLQNKATAMGVLKAKLLARKRQAEELAKMDALRGDVAGSWGDQMRSYVLHPYQMVKDLRTEYETGNPSAVFDGEIDGFIEAGIRWRKQQQMAASTLRDRDCRVDGSRRTRAICASGDPALSRSMAVWPDSAKTRCRHVWAWRLSHTA